MTLLLASKTSLILFLINLLNQNRTSESIFPHKLSNNNNLQHQHNSLNYSNPYHPRSLTENLLASIAGMTANNLLNPNAIGYNNAYAASDPLRYLRQGPYITTGPSLPTSSTSWMYQLPFATGSAHCDHSLMLEPEFHRCRSNAAIYWHQGNDQAQPTTSSSSTTTKNTCCFLWDLIDCMEEAIRRRCRYSMDIFGRNRMDYIARIQSNPLCFSHLYGSWSCMQENWILLTAFSTLALFIIVTICAACWTLFCRNRWKTKQNQQTTFDFKGNTVPPVPISDFDVENRVNRPKTLPQQPQQQQVYRSKRHTSPRRTWNNSRSNEVESYTDLKHIDSDVENNVDETILSPTTVPTAMTFKDYEPQSRRFHLRTQSPAGATNKYHNYSISSKHHTRTPTPILTADDGHKQQHRAASVVSVRQLDP